MKLPDFFNRKQKRRKALLEKWGKRKRFSGNLYYERQLYDFGPDVEAIDDKTAEDLDFDRFFTFTDRTSSVIGQQLLYQRLRRQDTTAAEREELETAVRFYEGKDPALVLEQLSNFKQDKDYIFPVMLYADIPMVPQYRGFIRVMQLLAFACILFGLNYPILWIALVPIMVVNLILHYRLKQEMGLFVDVFTRVRDLYKIGLKLVPLSHHPATVKAELQRHLDQLKQATKRLNFLIFDTKLNEREGANVAGYFAELVKYITLTDVVVYYAMLQQLPELREAAASVYYGIGEIDLALSVLALRGSLPLWSTPSLTATNSLKVAQLYHPLLADPVSNDVNLERKGMLITGSNMSGKSTFIKTLNLNALAAQNLNTAFASSYDAPSWKLATSMNTTDDLAEGASYYLQEVDRIGTLLSLAGQHKGRYLITID
ncbi:MAG: hypothetical protein AAF840_01410, partial [Bacteroidota bacterium]